MLKKNIAIVAVVALAAAVDARDVACAIGVRNKPHAWQTLNIFPLLSFAVYLLSFSTHPLNQISVCNFACNSAFQSKLNDDVRVGNDDFDSAGE